MLTDLPTLLDSLEEHVKSEFDGKPEVVEKGHDLDVDELPIAARRWHRLSDAAAVVADLKGSTNLHFNRHPASTASIYEAATGGVVRIFNDFDVNFVAIQGDGAVGLFWGDKRLERTLCAGITVKTFSREVFVPKLTAKWPTIETGYKVGIAASSLLAKRVGVPRSDHQEPVWAGRAVNYAAKCSQQADADELIVTNGVWDFVEDNDYLAVSCPCGEGPSDTLWHDVTIDKIREDDDERIGRLLTAAWCPTHGAEYCQAVLDGKKSRDDAVPVVEAMRSNLAKKSLYAVAKRRRRDRAAAAAGLGR